MTFLYSSHDANPFEVVSSFWGYQLITLQWHHIQFVHRYMFLITRAPKMHINIASVALVDYTYCEKLYTFFVEHKVVYNY